MDYFMSWAISILIIVLLLTLSKLIQKEKEANYFKDQWAKWEREYWLLRSSQAINTEFDIHLSWTPRGESGCITKINIDEK